MNIRVRGISYHFKVHQHSDHLPSLVMLHGFMGSGEQFNHLIPYLKQFCNPITIDLLGHGNSDGAELHYRFSTQEQIADLTKLIGEQLNIPLIIYGYSMGARLALQLVLHRPDLFKGLILESGTFGIESETERQARQALDARRSDAITGNFKGFLEEWAKMPLFESPNASDELLGHIFKIQGAQNPFWMANSLQGFGTGTMPCVRNRLNEISIPVQLIVGDKDAKFRHINRQMEKELQHPKLSVVNEAGHRVHLDQPEVLALTVKKFIQNLPLS